MTEQPNDNYIKQLANGNLEFEQKLISILKKEFPEEKATFLNNYNQKKYTDCAENVHKLKNKIGMLGLEKGYTLAVDFENNLKEEKTVLFSEFILLLDKIEKFISNL